MTNIFDSTDKGQKDWKKEVLEFLQVKKRDEKEEQAEVVYYDGECSYCGKGKSIDKLKREPLRRDWICDGCYAKRISKRADATYLADQSLKMLSLMYGIYPWKRFKVRFKRRLFRKHQYPWDEHDVVYRKRIMKYDRMYVRKQLPEETAEAAIVSVLLERYLIVRKSEKDIWDIFAGNREGESPGEWEEDHKNKRKAKHKGADRESRWGKKRRGRNGLVVWCTIHYLCIVRDKNCAEHYVERLSDLEKKQLKTCEEQLETPLTNDYIQMEQILEKLKKKLFNTED